MLISKLNGVPIEHRPPMVWSAKVDKNDNAIFDRQSGEKRITVAEASDRASSIVGGRSAVGRQSVVGGRSAVGRRSVVGGRSSIGRPIGLPLSGNCLLVFLLVF